MGLDPALILRWSISSRRQLDRWEECVSRITTMGLRKEPISGELIWRSYSERHLLFVAARNMLRAMDLGAASMVDQELLDTMKDVRDMLEHFDENLPIFNSNPQGIPRSPSGKRFAKSHPGVTPYSAFAWQSKEGAMLLSEVPASSLRNTLDKIDEWVLQRNPELAEYVPPPRLSAWVFEDDWWWPRSYLEETAATQRPTEP